MYLAAHATLAPPPKSKSELSTGRRDPGFVQSATRRAVALETAYP